MPSQLSVLVKKDTEHLPRQVAVFGVFRPLIVTIIGVSVMLSGHLSLVGAVITILGLMRLVNALSWSNRVLELVERGRPIKLKVFFSKRNPFSPFLDLRASIYDPRRYDPIKQSFQLHWDLLTPPWDAKELLGDAQECLAYLDRENGKVYAFATEKGALFTKPFMMTPWLKLDASAMLRSGQATNFE